MISKKLTSILSISSINIFLFQQSPEFTLCRIIQILYFLFQRSSHQVIQVIQVEFGHMIKVSLSNGDLKTGFKAWISPFTKSILCQGIVMSNEFRSSHLSIA